MTFQLQGTSPCACPANTGEVLGVQGAEFRAVCPGSFGGKLHQNDIQGTHVLADRLTAGGLLSLARFHLNDGGRFLWMVMQGNGAC